MIITLQLVKILEAINRNGSYEGAAKELCKVRSALTYSIQKTENRLGTQLFERVGRRAVLTPTGRMLLEQGQQLLSLSNQIEENIKQRVTGWESTIKIVYDEIINISPLLDLLKKFQQHAPPINLEIYSEVLGGCNEIFVNNDMDIAIGMSAPLPTQSNFVFDLLGKSRFVFVVAPHHPLASINEPISPQEIKKYYAVAARDSAKTTTPKTTGLLQEQYRITFPTLELKKQAQIQGLGVGFLPYNLVKNDIKSGRLIKKKVERYQPTHYCYLAWNKEKSGKGVKWLIENITTPSFKSKLLR